MQRSEAGSPEELDVGEVEDEPRGTGGLALDIAGQRAVICGVDLAFDGDQHGRRREMARGEPSPVVGFPRVAGFGGGSEYAAGGSGHVWGSLSTRAIQSDSHCGFTSGSGPFV